MTDTALDRFVAEPIARYEECNEVAAAKAKRAKGDHDNDLQQHLGTDWAIIKVRALRWGNACSISLRKIKNRSGETRESTWIKKGPPFSGPS
jgi:hypothetical protein